MESYISLLFFMFVLLLLGSSLFARAGYTVYKLALHPYIRQSFVSLSEEGRTVYQVNFNAEKPAKSYTEPANENNPVRDKYIDSLDPKATLEYIIDYCNDHPSEDGYEVGLIYFVQMVASKNNDEHIQQLKEKAVELLNAKAAHKL